MKKIITVFLCFAFSLMLFIPVNAETDDGLPRVVDNADLFFSGQVDDLTERAEEVAEKYDVEYILVTSSDLGGLRAEDYSDAFLEENGYGDPDTFNGIVFVLSLDTADRTIVTSAYGSYRKDLTDRVRERINELLKDDLKSHNYYKALKKHIEVIGEFYGNGKKLPLKYRIEWDNVWISLIVAAVVGAVVGGMRLSSCKKKMQVVAPVDAHQYLEKGSFNLRDKRTFYLYSTVTKTAKQKSGGSSGGSSSSGNRSSSRMDF